MQTGRLLIQAQHDSSFNKAVMGGELDTIALGKLGQLHRASGLGQQVQSLEHHAIEEQQILLTHVEQGLNKHLAI
jgi:hypothetical protein